MFRHVVMFTFAEGTTDSQVDAVLQGLAGLPVAIPEIRKYSYGRDAGLAPGNFSVAVVAEFDTDADYLVYRDHPAHQEFIATRVRPIVATRAAAQFASAD